jgi:DNA-binding IclR family transcriptional regulator
MAKFEDLTQNPEGASRNSSAPCKSDDRYLVPAVDQASRLLFYLAQADSTYATLTEICAKVGIHRSKAFSILRTLQKFGLVQKGSNGKGYGLGPGLIGLSRRFLDNLSTPRLAEPILEDLARKAGATAALGLIAEKNVFVVAKHEGSRPMGLTMRVGHRFPLTYGCHGKAIAAFLPEDELKDLLKDKKLYFMGDPERFDRDKIISELARCRKDWFAEDTEETAPGLNAVASPVLGPHGRPIGYVAVLGLPSAEVTHQCGPLVAEAGRALSRQLGARVDGS